MRIYFFEAFFMGKRGRGSRWGAREGQATTAHPMQALLDEGFDGRALKTGDVVEGVVVRTGADVLVDIRQKTEAVISSQELESTPALRANLQVGAPVLAVVLNPRDREGNIVLSLARAEVEHEWRELERKVVAAELIEAEVSDYNKGGLIVKVGKVRGFVPASQLVNPPRHAGAGEAADNAHLKALLGHRLRLKIIDIDRQRNRLILSERAAQRELRREQKDALIGQLREGQICRGEVTSLTDFGAFVDLGGADGLIHLSELAWGRVQHPRDILRVGESVEVCILSIDRERQRIALSLKRVGPEPWTQIETRYTLGQLVRATITKLADFGAFARLEDSGIEGLIHLSELSDTPVTHAHQVVKEGETLTLRIIRIDPAKRRLGLSLKRVRDEEYAELDAAAPSLAPSGDTE